jgi:hypothetical protein
MDFRSFAENFDSDLPNFELNSNPILNSNKVFDFNGSQKEEEDEPAEPMYNTDFNFNRKSNQDDSRLKSKSKVFDELPDIEEPGLTDIQEEEHKRDYIKHVDEIETFLSNQGIGFNKSNKPNIEDPLEQWVNYYDLLKGKVRSMRMHEFVDGSVDFFTKAIGDVFNGEHEFLGYKPDLSNWSEIARHKFKMMRVENSLEISNFIKKNNISGFSLFMLELTLSLVTHIARNRNKKYNSGSIYSSSNLKEELSAMREAKIKRKKTD